MHRFRRTTWLASKLLLAAVLLAGWHGERAGAQFGGLVPGSQFELADNVQLDQADHAVEAQLERVNALLAERQWDEAVEILRQVSESSEGKLLGVTNRRFIGLGDWCQLRLASLPPGALKLYRDRVDPVAKRWYEQGVAGRNRRMLQDVAQQAFASSYGDDALMALGEMALESGDYAAARWYWERIVPVEKNGPGQTVLTPFYPDSDLDLAAVRARLVLVSILEETARGELAQFARLHPDARGRMGGQEGKKGETSIILGSRRESGAKTGPEITRPLSAL